MIQSEKKKNLPLYGLTAGIFGIFLLLGFFVQPPTEVISGLWLIMTSRAGLVTDYTALGGLGAALVNMALMILLTLLVLKLNKVPFDGAMLAGIWMLAGFALFGKNIANVVPLMFGVWLHARLLKKELKSLVLVFLLVTGLAPLVSEIALLQVLPLGVSLPLAIVVGVFIGYLMPFLAAHARNMHAGYNLYNIGFCCGLLAAIISSLLRSLKVELVSTTMLNNENLIFWVAVLLAVSVMFLLLGFVGHSFGESWNGFCKIQKETGLAPHTFYDMYGDAAFINMGVLGLICTGIVWALGIPFNGPVVGGVLSVMAFGTLGKHVRNVLPVMLGAIIMASLNGKGLGDAGNSLGILFCTGLAPIAGRFGWGVGILAGVLHVALGMFTGSLGAGLNLYNNGFTAAFVALLIQALVQAFSAGKGRSAE